MSNMQTNIIMQVGWVQTSSRVQASSRISGLWSVDPIFLSHKEECYSFLLELKIVCISFE